MILLLIACVPFWMQVPPASSGTTAAQPPPPTAAVPVVPTPPPGSLWSEVGSRALIGMDGSARRVGDLITVKIAENAQTSLDADTTTTRDGSANMSIDALLGLETAITEANDKMGGAIQIGGSTSTSTTGTGKTTRGGSLSATLTCQVQEVLPNGNLRIRGTKEVRVNRETQYLTLEGIVRPRDILLDNTVASDVIAEPRIEYTGAGAIAAQQHRGIITSALDAVAPF